MERAIGGAPGTRRVSAVIPTFDRRRQVVAAIQSALRQTHPLHEIIVVDDGSTDGSWEDLQALAACPGPVPIRLHRQENAGPAAARNAGVRIATGEFIAFLDSDDLWQEEKTARQLALFDAQPEIALVGCVEKNLVVFRGRRIVPIAVADQLFRNYLLTPGVMVRRTILEETGGFSEDMRHAEDFELWLRIVSRHRCVLLNEVLMECGGGKLSFGDSGLSADLTAMAAGELEAFRRWRANGGPAAKYAYALTILLLRFARRLVIAGMHSIRRRR